MPVTVSGDAYKRIEAIAAGLSDDKLRDLTIQLRDSLVGTLRSTKFGTGNIGRGLTQYTEPVRTATGGWMVGIGDLDRLHRDPLKGEGVHSIEKFLDWYSKTYLPAEKVERKVERKRKYEAEITAGRRIRVKLDFRRAYKARRNLDRARSDLIDRAAHLDYQRAKMIAAGESPKKIEGVRKRFQRIWRERIPKVAERIREAQKRIDRLMKERQSYR